VFGKAQLDRLIGALEGLKAEEIHIYRRPDVDDE
jgi:hypothetical protein